MSAGDILGLFMALVALLALVGIIAGTYTRRLAFQERRLEFLAQRATAEAALAGERTGRIEERLRVVERIVTDKGYDVAFRIEALRHETAGDVRRIEV